MTMATQEEGEKKTKDFMCETVETKIVALSSHMHAQANFNI